MSTQRSGADYIIPSDLPGGGTMRVGSPIISSIIPQAVSVNPQQQHVIQQLSPLQGAPQPAHNQQVISSSLVNEVILNGNKYQIIKQIARSGEAEVFLVTYNGTQLVFKYYYSQYKPKDEILAKLKTLRHPYIIALYDFGFYSDRFFEISEFAQGGTLIDSSPINSLQKTREIVDQIVEGLNHCHQKGIIHRDIKPENIFYRTTYRKEIAIGDFGIASNLKEGEELVRTTMARTSLYAAPELFTNIAGKTTIEKSVDYYALGMSLLHLWFGRDPFEDVDEFGIMRLKSEGRVLFPDNINDDVENLIKGLITVNPRDRWSYYEVKAWLNGEDVKVMYQSVKFDYKPYTFGFIDGEQVVVNNPKDLIFYLEKYPDKGEGHLYRNSIAKWIETVDPGLYNDLMDIVEQDYPKDRSAGLTKAIYILDQERAFRGIDKSKLRTQEEIAAHFESNFEHYVEDLQNPNAPFYIFLESRNYKVNAEEYRNYFKIAEPEAALNTLIFKLEGSDKFIIGDYTIYQPEELLKVDNDTLDIIIKNLSNINSKLSIWISSFKKLKPSIEKWHQLGQYDKVTLRYALQQGFYFNNSIAYNTQDLYLILKNNFQAFFSEFGTTDNRDNANYWLKNYMDSSFCKAAIDYMTTENYTDKEFILLLGYSFSEYEETGMNLYDVVSYLLPYVKNKKSDNKKTGNKILLQNIVDVHQQNIELYWKKEAQTSALLFRDSLQSFVDCVVKNTPSYPELFTQLTMQMEDKIRAGINKDIELIKNDETQTLTYRDSIGIIFNQLKSSGIDLALHKRYNNETAYINKYRQELKVKNAKEKTEKIKITNEKFEKILEKYKAKYTRNNKEKLDNALAWNMAFAFIGIVLVTAVFVYVEENPISYISLAVIAISALIASRIGNNIGARITRASDEKSTIGGIIGLYVGMLLAYHFSSMIPIEKAIEAFGLYNSIPMSILYLAAIALLGIFGSRAYFLYKKHYREINAITLKPEEQAALDQNMIDIEKYFKEKEVFETYKETVRIITLDDTQFDKEFSKSNKAA